MNKYPEEPLLPHLAVCVTFFYVPERLTYLATVISNYIGIARKADIYIITNIADTKPILEALPRLPDQMSITFVKPSGIGHPYLLTWTHREIFQMVLTSSAVSHFMYSEDDMLLSRSNVMYWLRYRDPLQKHGLIPSFFRVELHKEKGWVSSDLCEPIRFYRQPKITLKDGPQFICMPIPYQAMYFLDRQLMEEFADSPAMSPDFGKWPIREKAAQGLTFVNIPKGYTSRNLVLFDPYTKTIPQEAWIHHLPNSFADDKNNAFGKLPLQGKGLFVFRFDDCLKKYLLKVPRKLIKG
jgi:hypothetical protein